MQMGRSPNALIGVARSSSNHCNSELKSTRPIYSTDNKKPTRESAFFVCRINHLSLAERRGFEPRIGYEPIHAFQACDFNHSSISPAYFLRFHEAAYYSKNSGST
jgi:hypothetical protein